MIWRGDAHRGEDAADAGADLCRDRPLCRSRSRRRGPRPGCSRIRELSRQAQDAASALFAQLFLSPKGDDLPPIDALGMFYEYPRADADRPARRRDDPPAGRPAGRGRSARSGRRAAAVPGRQAAGGRGARAGRRAARHGLSDQPQARPRHRGAARHPHRRSLRRIAPAAAAAGGARAERRRPPRSRARHHLQHHRPRGDPAALRHLLGVAALARGLRADRAVLRRPLARLQTAERGGEGRRDPRRGRICAGRGRASAWRASARNMRR